MFTEKKRDGERVCVGKRLRERERECECVCVCVEILRESVCKEKETVLYCKAFCKVCA